MRHFTVPPCRSREFVYFLLRLQLALYTSVTAKGGFILYMSLFLSAFLAATILPAQSEAVLVYQLSANSDKLIALVAVATLGNVSGAVVNWGLGRFVTRYRGQRWFPVTPDRITKAERHYRKFGRFSLLLSWVPFIGDPITVVAGILREPLWSFLLLVTFAKGARYIAIAIVVLNMV